MSIVQLQNGRLRISRILACKTKDVEHSSSWELENSLPILGLDAEITADQILLPQLLHSLLERICLDSFRF